MILESGIHDSSEYWVNVQLQTGAVGPDLFTAVSEHTQVCRYDRPGTIVPGEKIALTDRSTPVDGPRTIADVANDLEMLLKAGGIEPPYVLVGHSFGGFLHTYYGFTSADIESVWTQVQADLARLVPGTPHMIAQGSDHYIQVRQPDLVTHAILLTIGRAAGAG